MTRYGNYANECIGMRPKEKEGGYFVIVYLAIFSTKNLGCFSDNNAIHTPWMKNLLAYIQFCSVFALLALIYYEVI